jgi:Transposase DNA-binding
MDTCATPALSFGEGHFSLAPLGHRRRLRRLVFTADRIAAHPGGTLPEKLRDPAAYQGLMRLAKHPSVTREAVLHTHRQRTLDRLRQLPGVALLIHDSTELNYTGKQALTGLGQLGNGRGRGYVCHHRLAFDPRTRQVLGLARQILHRRDDVPAGESDQAKRERETRESLLWVRACAAIGPAPAGRTWVEVADRGADTFEFLDSEVAAGRTFVVRSHHDRALGAGPGGRGPAGTLHALARGLPAWYRRTVTVGARDGRPARAAAVAVAAAADEAAGQAPRRPAGAGGGRGARGRSARRRGARGVDPVDQHGGGDGRGGRSGRHLVREPLGHRDVPRRLHLKRAVVRVRRRRLR